MTRKLKIWPHKNAQPGVTRAQSPLVQKKVRVYRGEGLATAAVGKLPWLTNASELRAINKNSSALIRRLEHTVPPLLRLPAQS
ncbi:hypothetical protein LYZ74_13110 [Xanthomonas hortorum pv. gardneri]|nr:hypothetical protein [Xanthomonas hortorum]MCC8510789.1 hypothetical protein [Xanthomonas hortorum pv. gardneri]MCE4315995.1 hypothetical protein [Xanthomonas hortorum pv. gardneri]